MTDEFEKELEYRRDHKRIDDTNESTRVFAEVLNLYRSPTMKADRLAGALEEAANDPKLLMEMDRLLLKNSWKQILEKTAIMIRSPI